MESMCVRKIWNFVQFYPKPFIWLIHKVTLYSKGIAAISIEGPQGSWADLDGSNIPIIECTEGMSGEHVLDVESEVIG